MDTITLETPEILEEDYKNAWEFYFQQSDIAKHCIEKSRYPVYLHWKNIKYKNWADGKVSPLGMWALIKSTRAASAKSLLIRDSQDKHFTWQKLEHYDKILHELDLYTGGRFFYGGETLDDAKKRQYVTRTMIEESIASAQMEGAHTTREYAKKMIEEGRMPQDKGQRMIMNNYKAMRYIEGALKKDPLSKEMLFELHAILTEYTLDNAEQVGRFRRDDEKIVVGKDDGTVAYIPPPVGFVEKELDKLIAFANDEDGGAFIHPVIKAIILHFWIGFLHPFVDGNGRLARALFYWYLLRKDYWAFSFIPVSTRIKRSPIQYAYAYIQSEQDDNDLTYFIDYNLRKIQLARQDFIDYLASRNDSIGVRNLIARKFPDYNERQIGLIAFFEARPEERTNMTAMQKIYGVSPMTARNDLKSLEDGGLLYKQRSGRNVFYYPTEKLFNILGQ